MSKVMRKGQMAKKVLAKVNHSSKLRVIIPAGMASAKPLLGSQLGQRNINIVNFCKEFNQRTENIKQDIPLPCRVKVKENNTFDLVIHNPPATYFLKKAAGIEKGKTSKGIKNCMNNVKKLMLFYQLLRLKYIYIYNHIKYSMVSICWWEQGTDPSLALMTLQQICQMLVGIVRTCGIEIVHSIDSVEHAEFMKQQQEESELFKTIKLLRTTA